MRIPLAMAIGGSLMMTSVQLGVSGSNVTDGWLIMVDDG